MLKHVLSCLVAILCGIGTVTAQAEWHATASQTVNYAGVGEITITTPYTMVSNADGTATCNFTVEGMPSTHVDPIQFEFHGQGVKAAEKTGDNSYTVTSNAATPYSAGATVGANFYFPLPGGVYNAPASFVFGDSNAPLAETPRLEATLGTVTDTSVEINWNVELPQSLAGAVVEVKINGTTVTESPYVLSDLTPATEYTVEVTASATQGGETFDAKSVTLKAVTLRGAGQSDPVFYGEDVSSMSFQGQTHTVTISYNITANADGTATIRYTVDGFPVDFNSEFSFADCGILPSPKDGEYYTQTSSAKYTTGQTLPCFFYFPYAGGAYRRDISYVYASESNPPTPVPVVKAEARNITDTSAEIVYEVTLPEALTGAVVEVRINDETAATNPLTVTGLTPSTAYNYTITATATLSGEAYEAKPVTVSFSTLRAQGEPDPVSEGSGYAAFGENKVVYVSYTITAAAGGKIVAAYTIPDKQSIVGLVPKLFYPSGVNDVAVNEGDVYTFTLDGPFADNQEVRLALQLASAVGAPEIVTDYVYATTEPTMAPAPILAVTPVNDSEGGYSFQYTFSAGNVTIPGAVVHYEGSAVPDATGTALSRAAISGTADHSPFVIDGLEANTSYVFTMKAVSRSVDGLDSVESDPVEVKFTTTTTAIGNLSAAAGEAVYYDLRGNRVERACSGTVLIRVGADGRASKVIVR